MGHHIPALPPPILLPMPKTEAARWRPRIQARAGSVAETEEAAEGEEVYAVEAAQKDKAERRKRSDARHPQLRGGTLTAQTLSDDTLRTLLIGQEHVLNGAG
jgi:hypothetical protein